MPHRVRDAGASSDHPTVAWIWVAGVAVALVLVASVSLGRGASGPIRALGVLILILSVPLIVPPFYLLSRYGGVPSGAPYFDTSRLVERGPYAVVRHPQYLGYMLLVSGFALLSQHALTTVPAVLAVGALWAHARTEERQCERHLGEAYRAYVRRVPRFNLPLGILRSIQRSRASASPS